jgi:hypothetical protein
MAAEVVVSRSARRWRSSARSSTCNRAFFLRDRIGDVSRRAIIGRRGFGVFVVVDDPFVEGLVRVEALSTILRVRRAELPCWSGGARAARSRWATPSRSRSSRSASSRRKVDFALAGHRARHHDSHGDASAGAASTAAATSSGGAKAQRRERRARRAPAWPPGQAAR